MPEVVGPGTGQPVLGPPTPGGSTTIQGGPAPGGQGVPFNGHGGPPGSPNDPNQGIWGDPYWKILSDLLKGAPPPGQVNPTGNETASDGGPRPAMVATPEKSRLARIYGRQRVVISEAFGSWGDSYSAVYYAVAVCSGPIDAIEDIWVNGGSIGGNPAGHSENTWINSSFEGLRYRFHLGARDQAQDSKLVSLLGATTTRLPGVCYVVLEVTGGAGGFTGDLSQFVFTVRGLKVYDHRTGLMAWSQNPVLCIADYFLDTIDGPGADSALMRWSGFDLGADACDQDVGGSPRYVMNAVYAAETNAGQILDAMRLVCCADGPFMENGLYTIVVDAPRTVDTAADIAVETPAGTVDGSNPTYTLSSALVAGTYLAIIDGMAVVSGFDFNVSGTTFTSVAGREPAQWIRILRGDRANLLVEAPSETVDGVEKTFTFVSAIPDETYLLVADGQFLVPGADFTVGPNADQISIVTGRSAPLSWIRRVRGAGADLVFEAASGAIGGGNKVFGLSGPLVLGAFLTLIDGQAVISTRDYAVSASTLTVDSGRAAPTQWVYDFRGRPAATAPHFDDAVNCRSVQVVPVATADQPTRVVVSYHNAAKNYDLDSTPPIDHPDLASGAVELRQSTYQVEGVSDLTHAHRIGVYVLQQQRLDLRVTFTATGAENLKRGDLITLTTGDGLSVQPLIVDDLERLPNVVETNVSARQYSADLYADTVPEEAAPASTNLPNPWDPPPDITGYGDSFETFPLSHTATRTVYQLYHATDFVLPATYQFLDALVVRSAVGAGADSATWEDMVATERVIALEGNASVVGRLFTNALIAGTDTHDYTGSGAPTYLTEDRLLRRMIVRVRNRFLVLSAGITIDGAAATTITDLRVTPDPPIHCQGFGVEPAVYLTFFAPRTFTLAALGSPSWSSSGLTGFDSSKIADGNVAVTAAVAANVASTLAVITMDLGSGNEQRFQAAEFVFDATPNRQIMSFEFSDDGSTWRSGGDAEETSIDLTGFVLRKQSYVNDPHRYWRALLRWGTGSDNLTELRWYTAQVDADVAGFEIRQASGSIATFVPLDSAPDDTFDYENTGLRQVTFDPVTASTNFKVDLTVHTVSANGLKSTGTALFYEENLAGSIVG